MIDDAFKFIDLFCGIGGFHQAMASLGGVCVYACDSDEQCRKVYHANYGIVPDSDITKVEPSFIPEHDVLCAGFPCQAFSKAGKRLGFSDPTKGTLFFDVMRIARHHRPKYMLLENVRNLAGHDGGNTWKVIHDSIVNAGYSVPAEPVIFSPHYLGIPQHRERVFIMCVRKDLPPLPDFSFNPKDIPQCSIDSILLDDADIPNIEKYQLDTVTEDWIDIWGEFIRGLNGKLPGFPVWTNCLCPLEDNTLLRNPDSIPRWRLPIIPKNADLYLRNREFVDRWLVRARTNPLFFGAKSNLEWQAGDIPNPNIWDCIMQIRPSGLRVKPGTFFPALVAVTQTSIVGKRRRFLTPRECARLQSFPDSFQIPESDAVAYKQFGNSVNVEVVRLFARFMLGDAEIRQKYSKAEL